MNCPNCTKRIPVKALNSRLTGVHECPTCGAVFGQCYLGERYDIVRPGWHEGPDDPDNLFYFDLVVLGSAGITRIHGWADKTTRRIVQTG